MYGENTKTIAIPIYIKKKFKGHIGIVEKVPETSLDTGVHTRAITVLHEQ